MKRPECPSSNRQAALSDLERLIERVSRRGNWRQMAAEISTSTVVSIARAPVVIVPV